MRILNYAINTYEVDDDGHVTPIGKYSGTYPSEAFKAPQDVAKAIVEFLNEEFGLHMIIGVDKAKIIKEWTF